MSELMDKCKCPPKQWLAAAKDGGITFEHLPECPVSKHEAAAPGDAMASAFNDFEQAFREESEARVPRRPDGIASKHPDDIISPHVTKLEGDDNSAFREFARAASDLEAHAARGAELQKTYREALEKVSRMASDWWKR